MIHTRLLNDPRDPLREHAQKYGARLLLAMFSTKIKFLAACKKLRSGRRYRALRITR